MPLPHNENVTEAEGILAVLAPQSVATGASAAIGPIATAATGSRFVFDLHTGVCSGATIAVQTCSASGGTFVAVAGASATLAASSATNQYVAVEVRGDTLASLAASSTGWLQAVVTVGSGAACLVEGRARTFTPHYAPGSGLSVSAVKTPVVV